VEAKGVGAGARISGAEEKTVGAGAKGSGAEAKAGAKESKPGTAAKGDGNVIDLNAAKAAGRPASSKRR
jgi:hypothetical protein